MTHTLINVSKACFNLNLKSDHIHNKTQVNLSISLLWWLNICLNFRSFFEVDPKMTHRILALRHTKINILCYIEFSFGSTNIAFSWTQAKIELTIQQKKGIKLFSILSTTCSEISFEMSLPSWTSFYRMFVGTMNLKLDIKMRILIFKPNFKPCKTWWHENHLFCLPLSVSTFNIFVLTTLSILIHHLLMWDTNHVSQNNKM